MRRRRVQDVLPSVLGVLLAVVGGVVGNVVADQIPDTWKREALPALLAVALAIAAVSALRARVQGSGSERDPRRRSRLRRRMAGVLVVVYELLWAVGGLAENLAAGSLPQALKPYAWPLFGLVVAVALALALSDYLIRSAPSVEETNRRNFLTKLQTRYSKRQEDALRGAVIIALGLKAEPEAVSRPALTVGTLADGSALADTRELPAGTRIAEVYEGAGRQLLILGAPGAGKTTLLVELGLELVRRARANGKLPLPVICNLSTWAINRRPLDQWLVEDLMVTYQVPRSVARDWVTGEEVLPLLDGLDEVDAAHRTACVAAINTFHQMHPHLPLVVCSRSEEYRAQGVSLALGRAVEVQPLTNEQIRAYLAFGGEALAALRAAVEADEELREVVRRPLMLRVVTLTYEGLPQEATPPAGNRDAWVHQLFGEFVARMLKRRRRLEPPAADAGEEVEQPEYPAEAAEQYLAWLAWQMRTHGLVELYLERLQSDWLPDAHLRRRFRLASGVVVGLFYGMVYGLAVGLLYGMVFGVIAGLVAGAVTGLVLGLAFGLTFWLFFGRRGEIIPTDSLKWSWRDGLLPGLLVGMFFGVFIGVYFGMFFGLAAGLDAWLLAWLTFGLYGTQVDEHDYQTPNEGIHRSALSGVGVWMGLGLVVWLAVGLVGGLRVGLGFGLFVWLSLGPLLGLFLGGLAALRHATLRWILRRSGLVPPHLVRFLDYAADHVLLQRVGGGYRFVHILLRDYFADMSPQRPGSQAQP
jgi:hypothetical protein